MLLARRLGSCHASPAPLWTPLLLAGIALSAGCSASRPSSSSAPTDHGSRPVVTASAVESAGDSPALAARTLAFFDELETRSLVAHDDALEGILLVATGRASENYRQRVDLAKALGLIAPEFSRPAREATTIGEVAAMTARVLDRSPGARSLSNEQALSTLVEHGMLPPPARVHQGLTGAQLVSILGQLDDHLREAGAGRIPLPRSAAAPAPAASANTKTPEPLPELPATGPTVQATTERETATRAQLDAQLKAAALRESAGKKGIWIPGQKPQNQDTPTSEPAKSGSADQPSKP